VSRVNTSSGSVSLKQAQSQLATWEKENDAVAGEKNQLKIAVRDAEREFVLLRLM